MHSDQSSFEKELEKLRPTALDEALLDRLESCSEDTWKDLGTDETAFETHLSESNPAPLPADLLTSLEAIVAHTPFPGQQKVVSFPDKTEKRKSSDSFWWSRVAGVALLGAAAALYLPSLNDKQQTTANTPAAPRTVNTRVDASNLVPAGFRRGLQEATDGGIVMNRQKPHRVLKLVYLDEVTLKSPDGKTYTARQPRVEYILVPAETE